MVRSALLGSDASGILADVHTWVAATFTALFGLLAGGHLLQAILSRHRYLIPTVVVCGMGETLGWSGRLWSAVSVQWREELGGLW